MKPKNGRTTNQDYVNLLYSESDSDEPPDLNFKLPSFNNKPKKSRKKKSNLSLKSSTDQITDFRNSCTVSSFLYICIVIVLLIAVSVLGVMTFWLLSKITELKDQIDAVEFESKKDNEEFIKIQSDFKSMNKSIQLIKQENLLLKRNLSQLSFKFKNITDQSSKLTKNLKSIENLNKLSQIDSLSNSFAALGSDFKTFQTSISPTVDDLKKRVVTLENKGGIGVDLESNIGGSRLVSVKETFKELQQDIDSLNNTILNTVNHLKTNISDRVKLLESSVTTVLENLSSNKTSSGGVTPTNKETMKVQITSIINDMIKNKQLPLLSDSNNMTLLQLQVSNLTSTVHDIMTNHSQILSDHSTMSTNNQSLADIGHQTQMLNKTVIKLHDDLDVLTSKLIGNTNKLHIVSTTVNALKQYVANKEKMSSVFNVSSTLIPQPVTTTPASPTETSTQFTPVVIPGVNSYEDLVSKYDLWKSKSPDGSVNGNELKDYMPESTIELLVPYDVNGDGFSLEELAKATGLKKSVSDVPADLENM